MKRYSITGWWSQPNYRAMAIVRDRASVIHIDNSHAFSGILLVDDGGRIHNGHSILFDKNGPATLKNVGILNEPGGTISFAKQYARRDDVINYKATFNKELQCWCGAFNGDAVGDGTTRFVISELPDSLFDEGLAKS